jgi:hypothetical protein
MRKAIAGILISLPFSVSLFCLSATVNADEYVRGDSSKNATDIQPFDYSDRDMINPKKASRSPENVNPPEKQATGDSDSYWHPSQSPHRFDSESSSKFRRFRYGR